LTKTFGWPLTLKSRTGPKNAVAPELAGQNGLVPTRVNFWFTNEMPLALLLAWPLMTLAWYSQVTVIVPS
jgi:hypothetical protein